MGKKTPGQESGGYSPDRRESEPTAGRQETQPRVNEDVQRQRVNKSEHDEGIENVASPIQENEGIPAQEEPHRERVKPYKDMGDDSKENEKKAPTL